MNNADFDCMSILNEIGMFSDDCVTLVKGEYGSEKMGYGKFEFCSHNTELYNYDTAEDWIRKNIVPRDTSFLTFDITTYSY